MKTVVRNTVATGLRHMGGDAVRSTMPNIPCNEITIIAKKSNTQPVYVGGSNVSATSYGVELNPNESFTFTVKDANWLYFWSSVPGEGVSYVAV